MQWTKPSGRGGTGFARPLAAPPLLARGVGPGGAKGGFPHLMLMVVLTPPEATSPSSNQREITVLVWV